MIDGFSQSARHIHKPIGLGKIIEFHHVRQSDRQHYAVGNTQIPAPERHRERVANPRRVGFMAMPAMVAASIIP